MVLAKSTDNVRQDETLTQDEVEASSNKRPKLEDDSLTDTDTESQVILGKGCQYLCAMATN